MTTSRANPAPKPAHRPTLRTAEIQKKILTAMSVGANREQAALAAGVSKRTLYRWLEQGEKKPAGHSLHTFWKDVEAARDGAFRVRHLANIARAGLSGNWQASAWLLERNFPEDYSLQHRLKVDGNMTVELAELDQLRRRMDENAADGL